MIRTSRYWKIYLRINDKIIFNSMNRIYYFNVFFITHFMVHVIKRFDTFNSKRGRGRLCHVGYVWNN